MDQVSVDLDVIHHQAWLILKKDFDGWGCVVAGLRLWVHTSKTFSLCSGAGTAGLGREVLPVLQGSVAMRYILCWMVSNLMQPSELQLRLDSLTHPRGLRADGEKVKR